MKRMQKWRAGLAGLAMAALLQSAPLAIAAEGAAPDFQPPPESELPEGPFGEVVRKGRAVFMDTARMMPDHVGNVLSCANCHMDRGRLADAARSEEHTSELQSRGHLVCRLLLEKKK